MTILKWLVMANHAHTWLYNKVPLKKTITNMLNCLIFELHAVSVTLPIKLNIAMIYRPPGPLGNFFDGMDALQFQ